MIYFNLMMIQTPAVMIPEDRDSLLEEEILIVRHSGEIPEIALYSSVYYLTEDSEGPGINLNERERQLLYDAAIARACEIVLRDLDPGNRDLGLYRGPARTIYNWHRLQNLCRRIKRDCPGFCETVAEALVSFIQQEMEDVQSKGRSSSVNCSASELQSFMSELRVDPESLPEEWTLLCQE